MTIHGLNPNLINKMIKSKQSEAAEHIPHDEANLCNDCKVKRILWHTKIRNLAQVMMVHTLEEIEAGHTPEIAIEMFCLESLIMGFILGRDYEQLSELEKIQK